jgi:hypothetical protein
LDVGNGRQVIVIDATALGSTQQTFRSSRIPPEQIKPYSL